MRFAWFPEWVELEGPLKNLVFRQKKVCLKRYTLEKVKKKCWFRVGGAHIDVTTLERNCYFF